MLNLMIHQLPITGRGDRIVLRHWLTFPDGRIFFQDEKLNVISGESTRGDWQQLPTPPVTPVPVALAEVNGLPHALLSNGQLFIHSTQDGDVIPKWYPYLDTVPLEAP